MQTTAVTDGSNGTNHGIDQFSNVLLRFDGGNRLLDSVGNGRKSTVDRWMFVFQLGTETLPLGLFLAGLVEPIESGRGGGGGGFGGAG